MLSHRFSTRVCVAIVAVMLAAVILFCFSEAFGVQPVAAAMPYTDSLFSTDRVHTLDIIVDPDAWQEMLGNASAKEYIACNAVIDGNSVKNIGIRTKGNSSLSSIVNSESDRYSFKIEFDQYQAGKTYFGLDKLALNNIAQDNTYLKDYLSYQLMSGFGADSPLCSFIYITVNGEGWGLYLAVEGIEEAFAQRTYGSSYGQIYKPDNLQMDGRAGGDDRQGFQMPEGFVIPEGGMPEGFEMPEGFQMPEGFEMPEGGMPGNFPMMGGGEAAGGNGDVPTGGGMPGNAEVAEGEVEEGGGDVTVAWGGRRSPGGGFGGFGASDTSLVYTDDSHDSYSSIFDGAVFDPSNADKDRLISILRQLSQGENLEEIINIEEVLRYFVVHNYLLNFDSYTGTMVHNYYLREKDGQISMIAWDYNLAFGAFGQGGFISMFGVESGGTDQATQMVNFPIDSPVYGGNLEDRPLIAQLLGNEEYLARYHELFDEFIAEWFESGEFERLFDQAASLISPYVEKDPSAFCTYEEFLEGVENLGEFCLLRAQSIRGQLEGEIPSTSGGQAEDSTSLIDSSGISMESMGSMSSMFGNARGGRAGQGFAGWGGWGAQAEQPEGAQPETSGAAGGTGPGMGGGAGAPLGGGGAMRRGGMNAQAMQANGGEGTVATDGAAEQADGGQQSRPEAMNMPWGPSEAPASSSLDTQELVYLIAAAIVLGIGLIAAWRQRVFR